MKGGAVQYVQPHCVKVIALCLIQRSFTQAFRLLVFNCL